jgi:predicted AlkP superfamily phosphohydrolase/phosphomutase
MSKPRILVIGLDGATWDLIHPWAKAGYLPNMARLISAGSGGPLMSTMPPVSPAAWSSFMTGKNPGKHGVYDFTVRDFQGYGMRVAQRPSEPSLWGLLSAQGRRVCVVNVPQTYPPEQVNGYMVSGLGTPSDRMFTHPAELSQVLRSENYRITTDAVVGRDGTVRYLEDVYQIAEQVTLTSLYLMDQLDWDFAMVVLRLTDEIPHYFWHWMDASHPAHRPGDTLHREAVQRCYQKADELLGKLIASVGNEETTVLLMSDHGLGPLHKDVYLNEWLRQQSFLKLRSHLSPQSLITTLLQRLGLTRTQVGRTLGRWGLNRLRGALRDGLGSWGERFPQDSQPRIADLVDWDNTLAYSVGYIGQIYANLIGRDPNGIVSPGSERDTLLASLTSQLFEMVDPEDGERIVDRVLRKEEVYEGQFLPDAPDLLVLMRGLAYITRQGYNFSRDGQVCAVPPTHETGGHRQQGILMACGTQIAEKRWIDQARIEDIAPTILHLLGCEVPSDMDGQVLTSLLQPEFVTTHPVRYTEVQWKQDAPQDLTPEEEESLTEHLRNLGYLG